ncbi:MAG: DUF1922 domain-containing protein [Promethearchaeia archaeon]
MYNNLKKFYFYRCSHCGNWHYSDKRIKVKKCLSCHRSFTFEHAKKFSKECTTYEAISVMKELKKQMSKEQLNPHLYKIKSISD